MKREHKMFYVGNVWASLASIWREIPVSFSAHVVQMRLSLLQRETCDPGVVNKNCLTFCLWRLLQGYTWTQIGQWVIYLCCSSWEINTFSVLWLPALKIRKTWSFHWLSLKMKPTQRMAKLRGEEKRDQVQITLFI